MPDFYADRVADGTTTTGLGAITLNNTAPAGYRTLADAGAVSTNTVVFLTALGSTWEITRGTYTAPNSLSRDTLLSSSTGAFISWGAGTKTVSVILDAATLASALAQLATAFGWGDHSAAGYLTSETSHADVVVDGDFASNGILKRTAAGVYGIVTDNSVSWNTAYGWGDHASAGYLTSETSHADVVVDGDFASNGLLKRTAAGVYGIVTDNSGNWNSAYSWGNHASAGYAPLSSPDFTGTELNGLAKTMLRYNDAWLRLNPDNEFTSGIYCGTGVLRTDGTLQVGASGATLTVNGTTFTYLGNAVWTAAEVAATGNKPFGGNPYLSETTLTDGATITWTPTNGAEAKVTLAGNRTLDLNAIPPAGTWLTIRVIQDATGSRTLAYSADFDFGDAGAPTLSTGANKDDVLVFRSNGSKAQFISIAQGFA